MREAIYVLSGMIVMALLGMGAALADSKQELRADIVNLKDLVIGLQVRTCPRAADPSACSRDTSLLFQRVEKLQVDNEEMGFGPYGPEDPGVRAYIKYEHGACRQKYDELRQKYTAN
jgi:hypothetical protein